MISNDSPSPPPEPPEEPPSLEELARGLRFRLEAGRASGWDPVLDLADRVEILGIPGPRTPGPEVASGPPAPPGPASRPPPAVRGGPPGIPGAPAPPPASVETDPERRRRQEELDALDREVKACRECPLHEGRTQTVFGVGDPSARLMLVGEGPGVDEDRQGEPFVGKAGQLLDKMIVAMGLHRSLVYIVNIVKCRPPQNREPLPSEQQCCFSYLARQIEIIRPELIITLGNVPTKYLLDTQTGITRMRGNPGTYDGIPVLPTFHPAYLLRNPGDKRLVWQDLQQAISMLGLPLPRSGS